MGMRIDLLRHGETVGGAGFRGSTNDALTLKGLRQMEEAIGEEKPWQLIVSSPLRRCADFAQTLAKDLGIPVQLEPAWREMHFGQWEGCTAEQLMEHSPELLTAFWRDPMRNTPPGAEPLGQFQRRVSLAWQQLVEYHHGQRILVITHGGPMRILLCQALGMALSELLTLDVHHAAMKSFFIEMTGTEQHRTSLQIEKG